MGRQRAVDSGNQAGQVDGLNIGHLVGVLGAFGAVYPFLLGPNTNKFVTVLVVALARHNQNTPVELRPPSDRVQSRPRAQARTTRRDRERVVALYEQGWSGSRIAAELNITKSTVYSNLRRFDVEVRPQHVY